MDVFPPTFDVVVMERKDERVLVREVLVQRAHADAGFIGDSSGREPERAFLLENTKACFENAVPHPARALLGRLLAG